MDVTKLQWEKNTVLKKPIYLSSSLLPGKIEHGKLAPAGFYENNWNKFLIFF